MKINQAKTRSLKQRPLKRSKLTSSQKDDLFILNFEKAYSRNFEKLYKYAMTITLSEDVAKDVVSEVFFNLWNMKTGFAEIRELDSYLFIATKNQSIRTISQDPGSFVSIDFENSLKSIENINPEDLLLSKELSLLIEKTVSSLPDQCQLVFNLVRENQMKHKDVAEELGIAVGTVKNHMIKALFRIREELNEYYNKSGDETYNIYSRISGYLLILSNFIILS